jgi:hypothetical protein
VTQHDVPSNEGECQVSGTGQARVHDIAMSEVLIFGERFPVPKMLCDELIRLRAFERVSQDAERASRLRQWEAEHGPLPDPPESRWVLVEDLSAGDTA